MDSRLGSFTKEQKKRMMLSVETLVGITRTGQLYSTAKKKGQVKLVSFRFQLNLS